MGGPEGVIGPMGPDMPRVMNGQYVHSEYHISINSSFP